MRDVQAEPLGFSDLNEDESTLIMTFRDWQRQEQPRAVAEHAIARILQGDPLYPVLDTVFQTFAKIDRTGALEKNTDLTLSVREETLLTQISQSLETGRQAAQFEADLCVRPASKIARSGHDRMNGEVDRSYWIKVLQQALRADET